MITFFLYVVKYTQKNHYCLVHHPDGLTERKIFSKAHDLTSLNNTIREEIGYILHPEYFYYRGDYPNGFPQHYL